MYNPTCIALYGSAVYLIIKIVLRAVSPDFRSPRKTLSNNFVIVIYTIYSCSLKTGFVSVALEWKASFICASIFRRLSWSDLIGWVKWPLSIKHCQRHNGPEDWVHLTKVTSWGHITNSNTNLDQISSSESRLSINFKISSKHQHLD